MYIFIFLKNVFYKNILLDLQIIHLLGPVHLLVHIHITHALPT